MHAMCLDRSRLAALYQVEDERKRLEVASQLGPLRKAFEAFITRESQLIPLADEEILLLFSELCSPGVPQDRAYQLLRLLAPGGPHVGSRQTNLLVDELRRRVHTFIRSTGRSDRLIPHLHAFGSGGDFFKTGHATTSACILAAPLCRTCKTGTREVTSTHGSENMAQALGCVSQYSGSDAVNHRLSAYGFCYLSLGSLGFPYSDALRCARKQLWHDAVQLVKDRVEQQSLSWQSSVATALVPLDLFKIISPNAQPLNPIRHITGVCHLSMIPYVLGIFLSLRANGIIVHSYDGIDEFATATSDFSRTSPNNVLLDLTGERVTVAECGPEDVGFPRATLAEIAEAEEISEEGRVFSAILRGEVSGARRDFVVANAGLLLLQPGLPAEQLQSGLKVAVSTAQQLVVSGLAYRNYRRMLAT